VNKEVTVAQWCEWLTEQLEYEHEEDAWLYLESKPWPVTPELLYAVKEMLHGDQAAQRPGTLS
jgi:putative AlgH/UPF0301 family transcriptional regulator